VTPNREFWGSFTLAGAITAILQFFTGLGLMDALVSLLALLVPLLPVFAIWIYLKYYQ